MDGRLVLVLVLVLVLDWIGLCFLTVGDAEDSVA
jgi:hypothetical protein